MHRQEMAAEARASTVSGDDSQPQNDQRMTCVRGGVALYFTMRMGIVRVLRVARGMRAGADQRTRCLAITSRT